MNKFSLTFINSTFVCLLSLTSVLVSSHSFAGNSSTLTIGFGSCSDQTREQPIWNQIVSHKPDLFILMGDNVYIDSDDPKKMKRDYQELAAKNSFANFRKSVPLLATWDDHDYGMPDGGKTFTGKEDSKKAFLNFFDYQELQPLKNKHGGIFHTKWLKWTDKNIQIILVDTRWYRDSLVYSYLNKSQLKALNLGPFQPTLDKTTTLLGDEQWSWLENELKKQADLRIFVSSIQVLTEYSGWETWANFPHERTKLLGLIQKHDQDNTILLSGDIHRAEISEIKNKKHNLVEITSSGLAAKTYPAAVNMHRIGNAFEQQNYGILSIKNNKENKLIVEASIYDENGKQQLNTTLGNKQ